MNSDHKLWLTRNVVSLGLEPSFSDEVKRCQDFEPVLLSLGAVSKLLGMEHLMVLVVSVSCRSCDPDAPQGDTLSGPGSRAHDVRDIAVTPTVGTFLLVPRFLV